MDQQIASRLGADLVSVHEMYPIGWFSINKQWLADHGFDAKIVNIASLMLIHPDLDVRRLLSRLKGPIFRFDLHWMTRNLDHREMVPVPERPKEWMPE